MDGRIIAKQLTIYSEVMNASYMQPRMGDAEFKSVDALEVVRQAHDLGYKEQNSNKF